MLVIVLVGVACSMDQFVLQTDEPCPPVPDCPSCPPAPESPPCPPCDQAPVPEAMGLSAAVEDLPVVSMKKIEEFNHDPKYEIRVYYPILENIAGGEQFQNAVSDVVNTEIDFFKQEIQSWGEIDVPDMANVLSTLYIDYSVENATEGVISIKFSISFYFAGAAHPTSNFQVVNYDLVEDHTLVLSDLFTADADYLGEISSYCINDLRQNGHLDFEKGADPTQDNYANWNVQGTDGLMISFDPYQVGPYAAGTQTVIIPYAALEGIIDPEGPLPRLMD